MNQKFSEFSEFRESEKSLEHELGSIYDPLCYLCLAGILVSYTGGSRFKYSFLKIIFLSLNSPNSVKSFRENSNARNIFIQISIRLVSVPKSRIECYCICVISPHSVIRKSKTPLKHFKT